MIPVYRHIGEWRALRESTGWTNASVGLVPTMGALHRGHLSLIERARAENERVVLSIFVNPTQFNDPADLVAYPRTLDADLALVGTQVDAVIAPATEVLYPDGFRYRVTENDLSLRWEGAHRPGHFEGMLAIVLKLLSLARPTRAYFGEKDWQQLQLVRGMVAAFLLPVALASVDDALSFAQEAALPYVKQGFTVREDAWGGDLGVKDQKAVTAQLFKGNEYWFCLGTDVRNAVITVHIYDAQGKLVETESWQKGRFAGARVTPTKTGTYYAIITVEKSPEERTGWAVVYAYK